MTNRTPAAVGATALLVALLLATGLGLPSGGDSSDLSERSTIEITTGVDTGATSGYGLLGGRWDGAYSGTSPAGYDSDFDGDGTPERKKWSRSVCVGWVPGGPARCGRDGSER